MRRRFALLALWLTLAGLAPAADRSDRCFVCGEPFGALTYFFTDKVTGKKHDVCAQCAHLDTVCFLCGMPARSGFKRLPDGRVLCARDVKAVVLDATEARELFWSVHRSLEQQFRRFIELPAAIQVLPLDRVDLQAMYRFAGHDYSCPNVWGCAMFRTNGGKLTHTISLLQGLPASQLKATAAHELGHTWVTEFVPPERREQLDGDAEEGFCELLSYLYAEEQRDAAAMNIITNNGYTRGQFDVFLAAERRFGFNDIVDWMKYGVDPYLTMDDLGRVREVELPKAVRSATSTTHHNHPASTTTMAAPASEYDRLLLKNLSGPPGPRLALINDKTFTTDEIGRVSLGNSNVLLRCLEIRARSAVVQIEGTDERQELKLEED